MNSDSAIRLVLKTHNGATIDLTQWVRRLKWGKSLEAPYEEIDATLAIPYALLGTPNNPLSHLADYDPVKRALNHTPTINDWMAVTYWIEDPDRPRRYFARAHTVCHIDLVENIGLMAGSGGEGISHGIRILATSWLHFFRQQRIMFTLNPRDLGGAFSIQSLAEAKVALEKNFGSTPGLALFGVWRALANIVIPRALTSIGADEQTPFSTWIRFGYDQGTQVPGRVIEAVQGTNLQAVAAFPPTAPSLLDLLIETFQPDADMVELFCDWTGSYAESLDPVERNLLGDVVPVLIYRMSPFRVTPLLKFIQERSADLTGRARNRLANSKRGPVAKGFERSTWNELEPTAAHYYDGQIFNHTAAQSDGRRINAVTIHNPLDPSNPYKTWEKAGLPLADGEEVKQNSMRLYQPNWNFLPPLKGGDGAYYEWLNVIAVQAAQWHMGSEVFGKGTLDVQFQMGMLSNTNPKTGAPKRCLQQGGRVVAHVVDDRDPKRTDPKRTRVLNAYVHSYHHLIQVDGNAEEHASTHINYTRGLYDETLREPATRLKFDIPTVAAGDTSQSTANMWQQTPGRILVNGQYRPINWGKVQSGVAWYLRGVWSGESDPEVTAAMSVENAKNAFQKATDGYQRFIPQLLPPKYWAKQSLGGARKRYGVRGHSQYNDSAGSSEGYIKWIVLHYTDGVYQHVLGPDKKAVPGPSSLLVGNVERGWSNFQFTIGVDGTIWQMDDARARGYATHHGGPTGSNFHSSVRYLDGRAIHIELETPPYGDEKNPGGLPGDQLKAQHPGDPQYQSREVQKPVLTQRLRSRAADNTITWSTTDFGVRRPLSLSKPQWKALVELVASLHVNIQGIAVPGSTWMLDEAKARGRDAGVTIPTVDVSTVIAPNAPDLDTPANPRTIPLRNTMALPPNGVKPWPVGLRESINQKLASIDLSPAETAANSSLDQVFIPRFGILKYTKVQVEVEKKDKDGNPVLDRNGVQMTVFKEYVDGLELDKNLLSVGGICHHGHWSPDRWDAGGVSIDALVAQAERAVARLELARTPMVFLSAPLTSPPSGPGPDQAVVSDDYFTGKGLGVP